MKFTLEIELGNDAMRYCGHVATALSTVSDKLMQYSVTRMDLSIDPGFAIRDENGNTVGKWEIIDETACARCGVPAAIHGHWDVSDPSTHVWISKG